MFYVLICFFFFFKQKTAYEMRISDWSSDVCSSDLFTALTIPVNATDPSDASNGQFSAMKEIEKGFQVADAVSICVLPAIRLARINAINGFPIVVHPVSIGIRIGRPRLLLIFNGPRLLFYLTCSRLYLPHYPTISHARRRA